MAYLLVQLSSEALIAFLLAMVTTEDAGGIFGQYLPPGTNLARVNLEPIGQFGCCILAFERFQGLPWP